MCATDLEFMLLLAIAVFGCLGMPLICTVLLVALVLLVLVHMIVNPERLDKWVDWFWK